MPTNEIEENPTQSEDNKKKMPIGRSEKNPQRKPPKRNAKVRFDTKTPNFSLIEEIMV